jgi:hypothetical protein
MLALHDTIRERIGQHDLSLVIIDSKSVNWGGKDENSNDENAQFVAAVRKFLIAPFGQPAAVVTHHLTKQRDKEARTSRGGSALINNADHEWRFEMNQDAKISAMMPGTKVRMERWGDIKFAIKVVGLPESKLPQLRNNFGEMPRVSIADPVNQYARSMKQLQTDIETRQVLSALHTLAQSSAVAPGTSAVAQVLGWTDKDGEPDYRKVKRLLEIAVKQKLADKKDKLFVVTEAGERFITEDLADEFGDENGSDESSKES